jgi:hypothetical protein
MSQEHVAAVLSMLHEDAAVHSGTREFRGEPVLAWTLRRLSASHRLSSMAVICWEDQLEPVEPIAAEFGACVLAKGPRAAMATLGAVTAARRWADGWRGGLLGTCDFDAGFHAPWHREICHEQSADAVMLVDPSAGLVDPALVDALIEHATQRPAQELCFTQAAPGLCGAMVRRSLLERLYESAIHPGRLLHYLPDVPMRDPMTGEGCMAVPTAVARSLDRFTLASRRQVQRLATALEPLNGQLITSSAADLEMRADYTASPDPLPREIVLELTTRRLTRPIYWPGRSLDVKRSDMPLDLACRVLDEAAQLDDTRITLAGVGDPLLSDAVMQVIEHAAGLGHAVGLETDLVGLSPAQLNAIAAAPLDVLSIHLPAMRPQTYAAIMGVDAFAQVLEALRLLTAERQRLGRGTPLMVPLFVKCRENLAEMEPWYDQWLRVLGSAVIRGPSTCGGQIPDHAVADMAPPRRRACRRIESRLSILSDGRIVACEEDVTGQQTLGCIGQTLLAEAWQGRAAALRAQHRAGQWSGLAVCGACREWHRP